MSSPQLNLYLLGPFEARSRNGTPIQLKLKAARVLLSWLALRPNQRGSRDEIAALLWGERSESQAHQSLRQTLAVLRRSIVDQAGEVLEVDRETVAFAAHAVQSDVALLQAVGQDSAIDQLEQAVAQYKGEFLEGLSVRDPLTGQWLHEQRAEIRTTVTKRFEWLLAAYAKAGLYEKAEPIASRLMGLDPLAEEAHRALIRVYLAEGKWALAVRQYQRCQEILARELSVEPSDETKALLRSAGESSASRPGEPGKPVMRDKQIARTQSLSRPMSALVGRDKEMEEILSRLRRYRLVTLTGSGGVGKTRMAIEIGLKLEGEFADGVCLVELASISDPELVGEALCTALAVPVASDRPALESAIAHLHQNQMLLLIDNCEHLASASANLVENILRACSSVSILVTSRESLSVAGESLYRVPSLTYPIHVDAISSSAARGYSAVQLFVDRAAAIVEDFALDDANAPAVASICSQVEGIPLAIELAVGRLKMMRPEWLATNLNASFLSLRRSSRVGPLHHQTLRTMLDWSYDLLTGQEQTLLRRLSVFAGGCSLASAMRVAGGEPISEDEVFDLLSSLVEKSLVAADLSEAEPRYRLLETTRKYALEKQQQSGEAGRQHHLAMYLLDRLTDAGEAWPRTPTAVWLSWHEPELDNVRASLDWAFGEEGDAALGVALVGLSIRLWDELSLFRERQRWSEMAALHVDDQTPAATAARLLLARTTNSAHGDQSGFSYADQAVRLFRSADRTLDAAEALTRAGAALLTIKTVDTALPYLEDASRMLEPLGPTKQLASCLRSRGVAAYLGSDATKAQTLIERSMAVCRSVGDSRGIASAQIALAELQFFAGRIDTAIDGIQTMLEGNDHNRRQATLGWSNLASYLLATQKVQQARWAAAESLREARALGWTAAIVRAGEHLALVVALEGQPELAARLLGFAETFYAKGVASREWTEQVTHQRLLAELNKQLPPTRLADLRREGSEWSEQQAAQAAEVAAIGENAPDFTNASDRWTA